MKLVHVCQKQNHMATTFELRISCSADRSSLADKILTQAHLLVAQLEKELSEFIPESPIYRLNHAPPLQLVSMPASAVQLLERSEKLRALTHGSFNCAAKSSPIQQTTPKARIGWDKASSKAWRLDTGAWVGFGAIGKGYALDQVRLLVEANGFHDYVLSAGGSSILISGFAGPNDPWTFGWSWKKDHDGHALGIPFQHASGKPIAIGVSGLHEKGEHLLDPRSGSKANTAQTALVGCPSAADADGLSTALFVSGWEAGLQYMQKLDLAPAVAIVNFDGVPKWNGIFQRLWGPCQAQFEKILLLAICFVAGSYAHAEDQAVDLGSMGLDSFTPYVVDREPIWALLPVLSIALVLIHLKKVRRSIMKQKIKTNFSFLLTSLLLWSAIESYAVEFEPLGKAVKALLGTTKAFQKVVSIDGKDVTIFYSKGASGKPDKMAFIEKGLYPPNCTHTWAIGINPSNGKTTSVRVVEMSCPHAFPTKEARFLNQFKGKGPADADKLSSEVTTIAKATGSSVLTTDAVKRVITGYSKIKGQF